MRTGKKLKLQKRFMAKPFSKAFSKAFSFISLPHASFAVFGKKVNSSKWGKNQKASFALWRMVNDS